MSSFTDDIKSLTSFTPYRQQLPVSQMVSVGLEKQRRYDEGLEKIQSSIDRVAGLDIIRDVDKQYLESKLSDLGDNLKIVAGGDFSETQLVNSVAGMAGRIGKDPNIINAVRSTSLYKQQKELMNTYNSEGKGNPANDFRFNKGVSNWLNGDLSTTFNSSYLPPVDVWKKVKEIADEIEVDSNDVMKLYQTDERGNILYDEKGNAKWNPIAVEQILKGKDSSKILNAFQNALTSADFEQLNMEGEYRYANLSPQMLKSELTSQAKQQTKSINDKVVSLKSQLEIEKGKGKRDEERIKSLEGQILYFNDQSKIIQNSLERGLSSVDINPDIVRGSLYTNSYLSNMSNTLSSQEVSTKYSVSPMWTISKDQFNMDMEIKKYNTTISQWQSEYDLKVKQYDLKVKQFELEQLKEGTKYGPGGEAEGVPLPIPSEEKKLIPYVVESNYNNKVAEKNELARMITIDYYKRSFERGINEGKDTYEERIANIIDTNREGMDIDLFRNKIASQELSKGDNSQLVNTYREALRDAQVMNLHMKNVQKEAVRRASQEGVIVPSDEELTKEAKGTTINIHSQGISKRVSLTPQDILDFIYANPMSMKEGILGIRSPFVGKEYDKRTEESRQRLEKKFKNDYSSIRNNLFGEFLPVGEESGIGSIGTSISLLLGGEINKDVKAMIDKMNSTGFKRIKEIEGNIYTERGTIQQGKSYPVLRGKEKEEDRNDKVAVILNSFEGVVKDLDEVRNIALTNSNAVQVSAIPSAEGTSKYTLSISAKGKDTKTVDISKENFTFLSGIEPPASMTKPSSIMMLEEEGTTNLNGDNRGDEKAASTAFFDFKDFVKFDDPNYKIKGDLEKEVGSDLCHLKLYLYNKKGEYVRTITYPDPDSPNYKQLLLPMYNPDRSFNTYLNHTPIGIDATIVKQLMGENNGE